MVSVCVRLTPCSGAQHWLHTLYAFFSLGSVCVPAINCASLRFPLYNQKRVRHSLVNAWRVRPCKDRHRSCVRTAHCMSWFRVGEWQPWPVLATIIMISCKGARALQCASPNLALPWKMIKLMNLCVCLLGYPQEFGVVRFCSALHVFSKWGPVHEYSISESADTGSTVMLHSGTIAHSVGWWASHVNLHLPMYRCNVHVHVHETRSTPQHS